jgi:ABC-type glycerol-3-phosphate transport system substrate-binding protein
MTRSESPTRRIRRNTAAGTLAIAAALTVTAACGPSESTSGGDGATTITFWSPSLWVNDEAEMIALVDEFNESQDDVFVEYTVLQWADGRDKIKQAVAGGTGPDVFFINAGLDSALAEGGRLLPVEQLGITDEELAAFTPLIEANVYGGELLAVPLYFETMMLLYRPDILAEYGFDEPPATWEQLREIAATITEESGGDVLGYQLKGMDDHLNAINLTWQMFFQQAGGQLVTDGASSQDSPEGIEALEYLREFYESGTSRIGVSAQQGFAAGDVAMYSFIPKTADDAVQVGLEFGEGWSVAPNPVGPDNGAAWTTGHSLAANAGTEHAEAAGEFIRFMTSPTTSLQYMEFNQLPPYELDALPAKDADAIREAEAADPIWALVREQMARDLPDQLDDYRHGDAARWPTQSRNIVAALSGDISVEEALRAIDADIDAAAG